MLLRDSIVDVRPCAWKGRSVISVDMSKSGDCAVVYIRFEMASTITASFRAVQVEP
jgi:hypothetical protein